MQYILTPYSEQIEPFCWWENAFNGSELDWLQEKALSANQKAKVSKDISNNDLNNIRRSQVSWLFCEPENKWVFEKLSHVVSSINSQFYRFDLVGFGEPLQLTNYDFSERGMYGWHQDYGSGSNEGRGISRKLSLVLQLTDPSDYEGGNLQITTGGDLQKPINIKKQRGLIALFPSYQLHQVTPVTQGSRQSLVAWISGPQFK